MEFVGASKPDVFESFCDTPSMGVTSLNRIKKSVDRTLKFLDQTFEIFNEDVSAVSLCVQYMCKVCIYVCEDQCVACIKIVHVPNVHG
jgi:hypothetical protein